MPTTPQTPVQPAGTRPSPAIPLARPAQPVRPATAVPLGENNSRKILIIVTAIVVALLLFWWYRHKTASGDTTFRLGFVDVGNVQQTVSATGTLNAVKTVQVGTQVSGQVAAEYADFNDQVKKGQLLARIDPTLQEQAVRDAQAQLEKSQAQLNQA